MRAMDAGLVSFFASGKPYAEETYVWVVGRNFTTHAEEAFGLWTGEHTLTFTVFDPRVQANAARSYVGSGAILTVPLIPSVPSLQTQNAITFDFSGDTSAIRDLFRGKNLKGSHVEVHKGYFDAATDKLIANPMLVYVGIVDTGDESEDAVDINGDATEGKKISIAFIPHIRSFKVNSRTRSYATSLSRSGDTFYRWANTVAAWRIWWGRRKKGHGGGKNGGGGGGGSGNSPGKGGDR